MQQVIGPDVDGEVDVHPAAHGAVRLVVLGTSTYFSSTPTTPLLLTRPNRAATGKDRGPGLDPAPGGQAGDPQGHAGAAVGGVAPGIHLHGQQMDFAAVAGVRQQAGR